MGWLERHLGGSGEARIAAALDAAHRRTSGRIVPVLARRSARRGHCFWLASALCLCLAEAGLAAWGRPTRPAAAVLEGVGAAAGSLLLGWLLSRSAGIRRLLTPRADLKEAVHRAAEASFHRLALHRHPAEAGILLYASLEERQAVVLAGAGIHAKAGAGRWQEACSLLTKAAASGELGAGFERAVAHVAPVLARHHPKKRGGRTKPDRLQVLHEPF